MTFKDEGKAVKGSFHEVKGIKPLTASQILIDRGTLTIATACLGAFPIPSKFGLTRDVPYSCKQCKK